MKRSSMAKRLPSVPGIAMPPPLLSASSIKCVFVASTPSNLSIHPCLPISFGKTRSCRMACKTQSPILSIVAARCNRLAVPWHPFQPTMPSTDDTVSQSGGHTLTDVTSDILPATWEMPSWRRWQTEGKKHSRREETMLETTYDPCRVVCLPPLLRFRQ